MNVQKRITPAHAGKSPTLTMADLRQQGSPPHMRGKVALYSSTACSNMDHPRTCGEKQFEQ